MRPETASSTNLLMFDSWFPDLDGQAPAIVQATTSVYEMTRNRLQCNDCKPLYISRQTDLIEHDAVSIHVARLISLEQEDDLKIIGNMESKRSSTYEPVHKVGTKTYLATISFNPCLGTGDLPSRNVPLPDRSSKRHLPLPPASLEDRRRCMRR